MRTVSRVRGEAGRDDEAVLLRCLRLGADASTAERIGPLSEGGWRDLVEGSVSHGITPLLHHRLERAGRTADLPAHVAERLRRMAIGSALQNLRLYRDLAVVLRAVSREGIPVIVLKGAYLAEAVYGDIGLRPMRDVDLMVREPDLARTEATLVAMGHVFRSDWPYASRTDRYHLHPLSKPGGVPIEVHWTLESPAEPFAIDIEGLWDRAAPARVAGVDVLALSPEDLLLHLCLHASFRHQLARGLQACCDIRETVRHHGSGIDWERVQRRARAWGVEKYAYLTLRLAREAVGAAVPAEVLQALQPHGFAPRLLALARREMLDGGTSAGLISSRFAQVWGAEQIREKTRLLVRTVLPSPMAMDRLYPASSGSRWSYLYYPVRWKDLLSKYARIGWRLIRRDREAVAMIEREHERAILMDWLSGVRP